MKEKKIIKFSITDYNIMETHRNHAVVRAKIVNVGENNNQTSFTKEDIERAIPTIYNIPLCGIYNDLEEDFKSHARNEREEKQTYAVGVIPESCNPHFEEHDGMEYLVADIVVWKNYFSDFFEVMKKNEENDEQTTISMEISITDYEKEGEIFVIKDFAFESVFLLGRRVKPGIPNAGLKVIKFENGNIELENNSLYQSLLEESNEELTLLDKYCEKTLSFDNDYNKNNIMKGDLGKMAKAEEIKDKKEEVATKKDEEKDTKTSTGDRKEEVKEEKVEEKKEVVEKEKNSATEEGDAAKEDKPEDKSACKEEMECKKEMSDDCDCKDDDDDHDEKHEHDYEDAPLTKSERKTYEAMKVFYENKIAELKAEVERCQSFQALYEAAEVELKSLREYKEEAELLRLKAEKEEYVKTLNIADFDEEDRDDILKKVADYDFSFAEFKAFMADKFKKYGIRSRYSNLAEIINIFAEGEKASTKYESSQEKSDEEKLIERYENI